MPDLLSHVLFAYAGLQLISLYRPLRRHEITAGIFGAIVPDVSKIGLFLDDDGIEALVGGSVDFLGWHTLAGIALSVAFVALITDRAHRRRTTLLVGGGALGHLGLDLLLRTASGLTPYALFWPVSGLRLRTPGLYLSGDAFVLGLAAVVAGGAWYVERARDNRTR